ncbi:hypothetical protein [Streptomyces sp. 35G-GA-8]|uniref:hypothetical protein n=1 Tax=Streptomyces sp. 35G-GA-8 TaxID=2939434 RepID=UPI00201EACF2|nr:hypothetical protein [Streptomyces sp. 35G-GA-8]MCL7379850.1 hypothetical protein [Streptomyces sp. 35G-GA-8]
MAQVSKQHYGVFVAGKRTEFVDLPVSFERPLRLFAYIIGHSQVLFRGEQDLDAGLPTTVELLFKDVGALSVRDHYRRLTIRLASQTEEEQLRVADPRRWHDWRAFVLETESGSNGHVVAGAMYWAESPVPMGYSSFLIPDHDLPQFRPSRSLPSEPATVYAPFPRH